MLNIRRGRLHTRTHLHACGVLSRTREILQLARVSGIGVGFLAMRSVARDVVFPRISRKLVENGEF